MRVSRPRTRGGNFVVYVTDVSILKPRVTVSSQLVPKSTRTLVNSYPFLVNSYLTFGQLVPTPSQLVPESKNVAG